MTFEGTKEPIGFREPDSSHAVYAEWADGCRHIYRCRCARLTRTDRSCGLNRLHADLVHPRLDELAHKLAGDERFLAKLVGQDTGPARSKQLTLLREQRTKLKQKLARTLDAYEGGVYDLQELRERRASIDKDSTALDKEIALLEAVDPVKEAEAVKAGIQALWRYDKSWEPLIKRDWFRKVLPGIAITMDGITGVGFRAPSSPTVRWVECSIPWIEPEHQPEVRLRIKEVGERLGLAHNQVRYQIRIGILPEPPRDDLGRYWTEDFLEVTRIAWEAGGS